MCSFESEYALTHGLGFHTDIMGVYVANNPQPHGDFAHPVHFREKCRIRVNVKAVI